MIGQALRLRAERVCATLMLCVIAACAPRASRQPQPKPDTMRSEVVAPGVRYEYRWYAAGPWAVHSVVVDPRACGVTFRALKAQDHVIGRETPLAMAQRAGSASDSLRTLAAINADFFSYDPPGVSEGPQITRGQLIKSEGTHREALENLAVGLQPVFALTSDQKRFLTYTHMRGWIHAGRDSVKLNRVNVQPKIAGTAIFNSFYGDSTVADTATVEIVLREIARPGLVGHAGVIMRTDTTRNAVAIPKDGFVIALHGAARSALRSVAVGDTLNYVTTFENLPPNIVEMVGGFPMLLLHGKAVHQAEPDLRPTFSDRRHPRSAIAWGKDRRVHIMAIDGRQPGYSAGMTLAELGKYLLSLGFTEAMNFDGGGSTSLIVNGRMVNRPSDAAGERLVANAFLVQQRWPASCSTH